MNQWNWVKELVLGEQKMEESGVIDLGMGIDNDRQLQTASHQLMDDLKKHFIDAAALFNEMKGSPLGRVKVFGIAKTHHDFMLFRNGLKMMFCLAQPGTVSIRFNFLGPSLTIPTLQKTDTARFEEHLIKAEAGPFGEIRWQFDGKEFQLEHLVRYHFSLFVRESAK